jgi:hypothetical protein
VAVDVGCVVDFVDVESGAWLERQGEGMVRGGRDEGLLGQQLFWAGWKAGPDDVVGVDWGNEEGQCVFLQLVCENAIWEDAAGEVEEVTALPVQYK